MLTGCEVRGAVLFVETETLPEELIVLLTLDGAFAVTFGNPLIRTALIVK